MLARSARSSAVIFVRFTESDSPIGLDIEKPPHGPNQRTILVRRRLLRSEPVQSTDYWLRLRPTNPPNVVSPTCIEEVLSQVINSFSGRVYARISWPSVGLVTLDYLL